MTQTQTTEIIEVTVERDGLHETALFLSRADAETFRDQITPDGWRTVRTLVYTVRSPEHAVRHANAGHRAWRP